MDKFAFNAQCDLEVEDNVVLKSGSPDRIDAIRAIHEVRGPKRAMTTDVWFEFHLYGADTWVKREEIRCRLKGAK